MKFLVDGIQSLGAFPLDVVRDRIDFLSADAHKWMLGPEGIGLFYARKELLDEVEPLLVGWNSVGQALDFDRLHFEWKPGAERFEEGTQNGMSVHGLGACVDLLLEVGVNRIAERILALTDYLQKGLVEQGAELQNSQQATHRSGIVSCRFPEDPEGKGLPALERRLFAEKIYASVRRRGLRLSPHFYNTFEEMDRVLETLKKIRHSAA